MTRGTPGHCDRCDKLSLDLRRQRLGVRRWVDDESTHMGPRDRYLCPVCTGRERLKTGAFVCVGVMLMVAIVTLAILISL